MRWLVRDAFSQSLVAAATENQRVYLLTGDHGYALFDSFRKKFPERFINAGVAEQNMIGVAAGLSKLGFLPIVYGLSAFVPIRVLEQIKIDLCYENLPCVLIGDGAGVVYSHLGMSHQSTEDIACLRAIPNIQIFSPADRFEMSACFDLAMKGGKTSYIRMGKADLGDVHSSATNITGESLLAVKEGGSKVGFLATGSMVQMALAVVKSYLPASPIWSAPIIKPLNDKKVMCQMSKLKTLFVLEEHSVSGGLGSVLAEISSTYGGPRVIRFGIKDKFSEKCGTYKYLIKEHGLDFEEVYSHVLKYTSL